MLNTKVKKVLTKTANVLSIIIGVFVLIVAVMAISSMSKSYSSLFGYTIYAVRSDSMKGDNPDSFNKGDLIFVKLINAEQQQNLEVGQIITFKALIDINGDGVAENALNTHRIISVEQVGSIRQIVTQGDNAADSDSPLDVGGEDIVGVYSSKIPVLGNVVLFVQSPTGFLVTVVIPSVLVVVYCAYLLFRNLKVYGKEKKAVEMEEMRKAILDDMQKKNNE